MDNPGQRSAPVSGHKYVGDPEQVSSSDITPSLIVTLTYIDEQGQRRSASMKLDTKAEELEFPNVASWSICQEMNNPEWMGLTNPLSALVHKLKAEKEMVRLALEVSQDFDDLLEKLSVKLKTDKAGVFKKAIALYKFCSE